MIQFLSNDFPFWANLIDVTVIAFAASQIVFAIETMWKNALALRAKFPELAEEGLL